MLAQLCVSAPYLFYLRLVFWVGTVCSIREHIVHSRMSYGIKVLPNSRFDDLRVFYAIYLRPKRMRQSEWRRSRRGWIGMVKNGEEFSVVLLDHSQLSVTVAVGKQSNKIEIYIEALAHQKWKKRSWISFGLLLNERIARLGSCAILLLPARSRPFNFLFTLVVLVGWLAILNISIVNTKTIECLSYSNSVKWVTVGAVRWVAQCEMCAVYRMQFACQWKFTKNAMISIYVVCVCVCERDVEEVLSLILLPA